MTSQVGPTVALAVIQGQALGPEQPGTAVALLPKAPCPGAPLGAAPAEVRVWFDAALLAVEPVFEDNLASERDAALV